MVIKKRIRYPITISPSHNNGFVVNIGCAMVVYPNINSLMADLGEYLENPEKLEAQYDREFPETIQGQPSGPGLQRTLQQASRDPA